MSRADFCACTFEEFRAITDAWSAHRDASEHSAWERARIVASISIQPHIHCRITPQRLLPLPWDKKETRPNAQPLTEEQRLERFKELAGRG